MVTRPRTGSGAFFVAIVRRGFSGQSVEIMSDRLPNAIDRHVASRLRLRRLEAGMTQTQLAQAVGVTFQQLQKYEGATNRISAGALYQLALTLDVPVQYFFDGLSRRHKKRV
jgi:DNA-binding XRE family transcriptional regulator